MFCSLVIVVVLAVFVLSLSQSTEDALEGAKSPHPLEIHQRRAQEIALTFITQLNANKANATQLRALLQSVPHEDFRVFELAATNFGGNTTKNIPALFSSFPIAHHLLNQHMLAKSPAEKALFLEVLSLALAHGADAFTRLNNDPPLYHKALMIKHLPLLRDIFTHSQRSLAQEIIARSEQLASLLRQLYATPAEVVPIAKLLLHVEKLTHRSWDALSSSAQTETESFNATAVALRFLSVAKLERPSFSAAQLMQESERYRALVAHISSFHTHDTHTTLEMSKIVSLADLSLSLTELVAPAQRALLQAVLSVEEKERRWTAAEHLLDLHVLVDEKERNALHALSAANAYTLMDGLYELLHSLWQETQTQTQAQTQRERETQTEAEAELERASEKDTQSVAEKDTQSTAEKDREKLRALAAVLLRGCEQVDLRGHTPLSYAETRYGARSEMARTLRVFIERLLRIYGGDFSVFSAQSLQEMREEREEEEMNEEREEEAEEQSESDESESESEKDVEVSVDGVIVNTESVREEESLKTDENVREEQEDEFSEREGEKEEEPAEERREIPLSDAGGWSTERLSLTDSDRTEKDTTENENSAQRESYGRCDVPEIFDEDLPSNEEFFARFVNTGTPVVFRGAALRETGAMHRLREVFAKKEFVRVYGKVSVTASTLPYSDSFGVKSSMKTLREVANSDTVLSSSSLSTQETADKNNKSSEASVPLYTFTTASPQWADRLHKDVPLPKPLRAEHTQKGESKAAYSYELQFYLGPAGTGAPVHFHGHAVNTLAYGEKKWILYPPEHGFYTTIPALDFFRLLPFYNHTATVEGLTSNNTVNAHVPNLAEGALQCTQHAGDIFYVPTLWAHGTLNVKQSIGVAHEFSVESFCME